MDRKVGKNRFIGSLRNQNILIVILGIGLVGFYAYHINSLHAVLWELGDEAVYLWNAAYFAGTDWDNFAGQYAAYSGYGYSILLVPLFGIVHNGIQLVNGAYIINVICVLGMYLVLIKFMKELSKKPISLYIPVIAFTSCLMPCIVSNTLKVLCETFLSFWYSLLVLLLYLALKNPKKYMGILGICGAFSFFIHTRAIVIVGTLVLILLIDIMKRKEKNIKYAVISLIIMAGTFIILYLVKANIVHYLKKIMHIVGNDIDVENILTIDNVLVCLRWFTPVNFICNFLSKVFYAICETGVVLMPGIFIMCKRVYISIKRHYFDEQEWETSGVIIFVVSTYIFTLMALVYKGYGSDFRYAIYGRYYEYMFPIMLSLCLHYFIEHGDDLSIKERVICFAFVVCIGIITRIWCVTELPNQSVSIDTNRLAAFSKAIAINDSLETVIEFLILNCSIYMCVYIVVYRKRFAHWIVLCIVFIALFINDAVCLDEIHKVHNRKITDTEIAEYLISNAGSCKVYMIDDNSYWYPYVYSKMQIYLKDQRLYVIAPDESRNVEDGSYVMTYSTSELENSSMFDYQLLLKGSTFNLYQK